MKDNEKNEGEEQDNPTLFDIVRKNQALDATPKLIGI